ncbi:transposase [Melioribacter sp. Ez-97]|jgi:transposase-like protein|uniref:transposase n=1 Tax=Melioribacter sp. Ez-97 TaxID=3423434 RepID=UPI003EDA2D77
MQQRKHYTAEQKVMILRELLENNVPISQLAEKYKVRPNDIYNWKKKLFESATEIFMPKKPNTKQTSAEQKKIEKLQAKLKDRDEAISYLLRENIEIKKSISGDD